MSAERERASPDSSKINASPSLLQSDISSAKQQETTPSRNANMSTPRPEGAQRRETNRISPQRFNRPNPAVAAGESSAEREPVRHAAHAGIHREGTNNSPRRTKDRSVSVLSAVVVRRARPRAASKSGMTHSWAGETSQELSGDHFHAAISFALAVAISGRRRE